MINIGKRGTDDTWKLVKYRGDGAIYAKCKCRFDYNCGRNETDADGNFVSFKQIPTVFYPYCPYCGAKKKWVTEDIERIDKYRFE